MEHRVSFLSMLLCFSSVLLIILSSFVLRYSIGHLALRFVQSSVISNHVWCLPSPVPLSAVRSPKILPRLLFCCLSLFIQWLPGSLTAVFPWYNLRVFTDPWPCFLAVRHFLPELRISSLFSWARMVSGLSFSKTTSPGVSNLCFIC